MAIAGKFLIGVGTNKDSNNESMTFSVNQTGGEYNHTLTLSEMPKHAHQFALAIDGGNDTTNKDRVALNGYGNSRWWPNLYKMDDNGGNQKHNNIPPYLAVYIWQRTG